jgi:hypothetical protein
LSSYVAFRNSSTLAISFLLEYTYDGIRHSFPSGEMWGNNAKVHYIPGEGTDILVEARYTNGMFVGNFVVFKQEHIESAPNLQYEVEGKAAKVYHTETKLFL